MHSAQFQSGTVRCKVFSICTTVVISRSKLFPFVRLGFNNLLSLFSFLSASCEFYYSYKAFVIDVLNGEFLRQMGAFLAWLTK